MAIPTNHIDKITDHDSGESRPICPPADHVSVDNENYEGETLDEVLDEVAQAIEEAGQGGYAPPAGGIPKTDLAQSVQDSLDKADSALQDEDVAEVAKTGDYDDLLNKPTIPDTSGLATKTELNAKQDKLQAGNGIVIAQDGKTVSVDAEVVQPVTADGTFAVRIGNNTYTINLNHTHENMAKIVKCTEATLPQKLDDDTIYVQVDNETTPTYIECIYLFGLEFTGGGVPAGSPVITLPKASVINLGTAYGQGGAKGKVTIRAKNLSEPLTVRVGTGFSLAYGQSTGQSITIPVADATVGADVDVFADAYATAGTLLIYGETDNVSLSVSLTSNVIEELEAVKFNGAQWIETDVHPTANIKLELDCLFEKNSITENGSVTRYSKFIDARYDDNGVTRAFSAQFGTPSEAVSNAYKMQVWLNRPYGSSYQHFYEQNFNNEATLCQRSTLTLNGVSGLATFQSVSWGTDKPEGTNNANIAIGINQFNNGILNVFDLTVYSLKLYNGNILVREYLPVKKNGITGLLDSVSGAFISSSTSTELVPVTAVSQS